VAPNGHALRHVAPAPATFASAAHAWHGLQAPETMSQKEPAPQLVDVVQVVAPHLHLCATAGHTRRKQICARMVTRRIGAATSPGDGDAASCASKLSRGGYCAASVLSSMYIMTTSAKRPHQEGQTPSSGTYVSAYRQHAQQPKQTLSFSCRKNGALLPRQKLHRQRQERLHQSLSVL
jgi:hypothetical protein